MGINVLLQRSDELLAMQCIHMINYFIENQRFKD